MTPYADAEKRRETQRRSSEKYSRRPENIVIKREQDARRYQEKGAEMRAYQKEYYRTHRDQELARQKKYREKRREAQ